jgi:hypothetical protein
LAEAAEMAYHGRNDKGEWVLALGSQAQTPMIDIIGMSLIPVHVPAADGVESAQTHCHSISAGGHHQVSRMWGCILASF